MEPIRFIVLHISWFGEMCKQRLELIWLKEILPFYLITVFSQKPQIYVQH